jgi:HK97 family phage major capsid protein
VDPAQLNFERSTLIAEMRLALDLASAEKRELTGEETAAYDAREARVDKIERELGIGNHATRKGIPRSATNTDYRSVVGGDLGGGEETKPRSLGESLYGAIDDVASGRVSSAFVDPAFGERTDVRDHEQRAAQREERAFTDAGDAGGAVPIEWANHPLWTLRAKSVVLGLPGINIVSMGSDRLRFPRLDSVTGAGASLIQKGVAENASLTDNTANVDEVDLVPVSFKHYALMSSEFLEDASLDGLTIFAENALQMLQLQVDASMLQGTGASDLVGIQNIIGAQTTSLAASQTDFAKFQDTLYLGRANNANPTQWLMHPRTFKDASKLVTGIASDRTTLLQPDLQSAAKTLLGLDVNMSTQITLTGYAGAGSWAAAVDPTQLIVGVRRPPLLEISRDVAFQSDAVALKITARYGFAAINASGISLLTDIR